VFVLGIIPHTSSSKWLTSGEGQQLLLRVQQRPVRAFLLELDRGLQAGLAACCADVRGGPVSTVDSRLHVLGLPPVYGTHVPTRPCGLVKSPQETLATDTQADREGP
jgi:hypothetical protein